MTATHRLKTEPECWDAVASGEKKFEVRLNDRCYQPGDTVILQRLCRHQWGTGGFALDGQEITKKVGWMLQGGRFGIVPGYVVFSLGDVDEKETD